MLSDKACPFTLEKLFAGKIGERKRLTINNNNVEKRPIRERAVSDHNSVTNSFLPEEEEAAREKGGRMGWPRREERGR